MRIAENLTIDERELRESFVRASGPGGQNVNKVSSAVQLRFDVRRSPSLPEDAKARLAKLAGRRLSNDGVLVITAERFRSQEQNRTDARARLADLIRRALVAPRPRRATRPTLGSKTRRLAGKAIRSVVKADRRTPDHE